MPDQGRAVAEVVMRKTVTVLVTITAATALAMGAEQQAKPSTLPLSKAKSACIAMEDEAPRWGAPAPPDCRMTWTELGRLGEGRTLYAGRYTWPSAVSVNMNVVGVIVFERADKDEVVTPLVWFSEEEGAASLEAVHLRSVDHLHFLEVERCPDGAGGCRQEFYQWSPGELRDVTKTLDDLIDGLIPAGHKLRKTPRLDLEAMAGEAVLWGPDDPDAESLTSLTFHLAWDASGFVIASSRTRKASE